jgi:hypothetical protein
LFYMACLKLTYYQENQLNLKVVWRKPEPGKPVPRFTSVDPLAEKYPWQSTYVYAAGNPIRYIDWMGLGPLGADELTDEEWMETSRPNSDSRMAREYRQQNLAAERAIADLSNFVHGKFKQNPHATVGGLLPGDWDGEGEGAKGGGTPWYSIYNWPVLGSSARTMDALYAGDYLSATGHFLTCGAEVFTLGYSSTINLGFKATSVAAKGGSLAEKAFLSEGFGITSEKFGSSLVKAQGSLNQTGSIFKMGWSNVAKNGGGMQMRIGIGSKATNPNQALFHMYVPKTFVPNSFANPSMQVKLSLYKLGL